MNTSPSNYYQPGKADQSATLAKLELFIRLGNMSDLDPNQHFADILRLGNALIEGEINAVQKALSFYASQSELLDQHIGFLRRAFAHTGVDFLESASVKYENGVGQTRTVLVLSVVLERSGKVAFVSSDPVLASYVHSFTRSRRGAMMMEPAQGDPGLLLKQISRVIRLPETTAPPPNSMASSLT